MKNPNSISKSKKVRVALVIPHIFMHRDILPNVIFSPGHLALALASGLQAGGVDVTLFTPGPVDTDVPNITADLSLFDQELAGRGEEGDTYMDLLRKHPFTFITLARQVQSELIAKVYAAANADQHDLVHIYTNEEEIAMPFAQLCTKPVVFTHHDPFNFLVKYKNNFPKYKHLNWISLSYAQRFGMPDDTNWVANIYHGLDDPILTPAIQPTRDYVAYLGRIIEPKGVHLAIAAVRQYNKTAKTPSTLKIAGKHYAEESKDSYWKELIEPELGDDVEYVGFIDSSEQKRDFLGNARALLVPSLFDEPFGMVTLEAFACGTPVIALDSGALPEVIEHGKTGLVIQKSHNKDGKVNDNKAANDIAKAISQIESIDRQACHRAYSDKYANKAMVTQHVSLYERLAGK